ncbi:DNA-binding PadR family transcriptional regulator [Tamaricihabitans halophyticus]|uniref:DNA-binding PadR family transcriptional regulator n=1 Tax=Tamaricihabitans halophyticus TaxID=1262583 RepID=A0A4R2QU39_9PSEU|nr:PadR family transcriptional regulator [Tamaricihabitans halophyticus]TCP53482.1 DNA-binding PadR family transcriptional regulator [Tamaricihabitans halophyticus]
MATTKLLVLGSVRDLGQAHGYQVRRDLEDKGVHVWAKIQQGSIYHALRKLAGDGLLQVAAEGIHSSVGPARTEYVITPAGEAAYFALIADALSSLTGDIGYTIAGIGCMSDLPRARVLELLRRRVEAYTAWRAEVVGVYEASDGDWMHHVEAIRLWAHTADSAITWTEDLIGRLENGEYTFVDD